MWGRRGFRLGDDPARGYEPNAEARRLSVWLQLLELRFTMLHQLQEEELPSWDRSCTAYECFGGRGLDSELKIALVMAICPEPLGFHLRMYGDAYNKV